MAEEIDLRFLGEQIKRLQGDVRQVKSDMAQMRADNVKVDSDVVALSAALSRMEGKLEAFRETVDDRFDQQVELIKSSFRSLSLEITTLKKS
jgi:outer membrane murein-binding lipoprotein Lpp